MGAVWSGEPQHQYQQYAPGFHPLPPRNDQDRTNLDEHNKDSNILLQYSTESDLTRYNNAKYNPSATGVIPLVHSSNSLPTPNTKSTSSLKMSNTNANQQQQQQQQRQQQQQQFLAPASSLLDTVRSSSTSKLDMPPIREQSPATSSYPVSSSPPSSSFKSHHVCSACGCNQPTAQSHVQTPASVSASASTQSPPANSVNVLDGWTYREPPPLPPWNPETYATASKESNRSPEWEKMGADFLCALALSPTMLAWYADVLSDLLTSSLSNSQVVQQVDYVQCSFPCLESEKPNIRMIRWLGMHGGEFEVDWQPKSWWIALSVQGGLGAQLVVTISGLSVKGIARTALSYDCSALRLSFWEFARLDMNASSKVVVGTGSLPIPMRAWIEKLVVKKVEEIVHNYLVSPNERVIVLRRTIRPRMLSDADLANAEKAAQRASRIS